MSRTYTYSFTVTCASNGNPNLPKVEELIDLSMQDLVYDDAFIEAFDEQESVTIQVLSTFGKTRG